MSIQNTSWNPWQMWTDIDSAIREASGHKYSVDLCHQDITVVRLNTVIGEDVGTFYRRSRDNYDVRIRANGLTYKWEAVGLSEITEAIRNHSALHR